MNKVILFLIGICFFSVHASDWYPSPNVTQSDTIELEPLTCPTIGKDYSQMLSKLQGLQDKISKDANCEKLKRDLERIGYLSGERREKFLEVIEKIKKGEKVRDKDMKKYVLEYVESITVATGGLSLMLSGSAQCFGRQKPTDTLFALSSFVNEASTLLSTVAGPWGPALAIGGKIAAGFLSGVKSFIESRPGFDFHEKEEWQGYIETLCSFHEQQDEIYALIHPEKAKQELSQLQGQLDVQVKIMKSQIIQSDQLVLYFDKENDEGILQTQQLINTETGSTMGLKLTRLLTAERWLVNRVNQIEKEATDPLAPSRFLVQKYRDEIETFMIDREAPRFIDHQLNETNHAIRDFDRFASRDGRLLYNQIKQLRKERALKHDTIGWRRSPQQPDVSIFKILETIINVDPEEFYEMGGEAEDVGASILFFQRELQQKWDAVQLGYGVKQSFCTFFRKAGYLTQRLRGQCRSSVTQRIEQIISTYQNAGLFDGTPLYLSRAQSARGTSWFEALDYWVAAID